MKVGVWNQSGETVIGYFVELGGHLYAIPFLTFRTWAEFMAFVDLILTYIEDAYEDENHAAEIERFIASLSSIDSII